MPPQISEDEASEEGSYEIEEKKRATAGKGNAIREVVEETQEALNVESDMEDRDEEDDDEPGADEYVVEAIKGHAVDEETGEILYEVKWEGYAKKTDRTWEPEANLETAPAILEEYLAKVGGKEQLLEQWAEKKSTAGGKGKKRGRTNSGINETAAKKGRKNGLATASTTPPAGVKEAEFKPPTGSWEDEVVLIDACEGTKGAIVVFLTWKGGQKTQHPLAQVYKRCPQKMLKFYESHLVFKKNEDSD